jgi:hypothetical protein
MGSSGIDIAGRFFSIVDAQVAKVRFRVRHRGGAMTIMGARQI